MLTARGPLVHAQHELACFHGQGAQSLQGGLLHPGALVSVRKFFLLVILALPSDPAGRPAPLQVGGREGPEDQL